MDPLEVAIRRGNRLLVHLFFALFNCFNVAIRKGNRLLVHLIFRFIFVDCRDSIRKQALGAPSTYLKTFKSRDSKRKQALGAPFLNPGLQECRDSKRKQALGAPYISSLCVCFVAIR
nr:hypothetical protein [Haliscomenobacter hydrossis]